jgi:hypothetical protein
MSVPVLALSPQHSVLISPLSLACPVKYIEDIEGNGFNWGAFSLEPQCYALVCLFIDFLNNFKLLLLTRLPLP